MPWFNFASNFSGEFLSDERHIRTGVENGTSTVLVEVNMRANLFIGLRQAKGVFRSYCSFVTTDGVDFVVDVVVIGGD